MTTADAYERLREPKRLGDTTVARGGDYTSTRECGMNRETRIRIRLDERGCDTKAKDGEELKDELDSACKAYIR